MEHVIQLGINIDDEAIKKAVVADASRKISEELRQQIFSVGYGGSVRGLSDYSEILVKDVMEANKEEIIKRTAELLADSLRRSKKFRDAMAAMDSGNEA